MRRALAANRKKLATVITIPGLTSFSKNEITSYFYSQNALTLFPQNLHTLLVLLATSIPCINYVRTLVCFTVKDAQHRGGTPSMRTRVCSTDQSHHQYVGGTPLVQTRVCSTDLSHHIISKVHSLSSGKVAATPILKSVPSQFSPFIL